MEVEVEKEQMREVGKRALKEPQKFGLRFAFDSLSLEQQQHQQQQQQQQQSALWCLQQLFLELIINLRTNNILSNNLTSNILNVYRSWDCKKWTIFKKVQ